MVAGADWGAPEDDPPPCPSMVAFKVQDASESHGNTCMKVGRTSPNIHLLVSISGLPIAKLTWKRGGKK